MIYECCRLSVRRNQHEMDDEVRRTAISVEEDTICLELEPEVSGDELLLKPAGP